MKIRPLSFDEIDEYVSHIVRGLEEVARGDTPIFSIYNSVEEWNPTGKKEIILSKLSKPLTAPGWKRVWIIQSGPAIVGRIELEGHSSQYALHRATLSLGVEAKFRKQGFGRRLIESAISWAKNETTLDWIDLYVFAHNEPAISLYRQMGFIEVGRIDDLFRLNGNQVSDLTMTLRLR